MNYILTAKTGHYNISPDLFHAYAVQYLACFKSYVPDTPVSPVPYFLLCRAIELELKAKHLVSKSRKEVKNSYGHDLKAAYDDMQAACGPLDRSEYDVLCAASTIYSGKGFEYVEVREAAGGFAGFPNLRQLEAIARKLIPT
jgi:hypothetical protein